MASATLSQYVANKEFFADFDPELLDHLTRHASWRQVARNEVLFRHDDLAESFFVIKNGSVVLEVPAITGPSLLVQEIGSGEVLGWSWLIPPYRWSFHARATQPSDVVEFDGKAIREHCDRNPEFGYKVLKHFSALMSERLTAARAKMMEEWNPPGFA